MEEKEKYNMNTFWILLEQMELFVIYILAGVMLVKSGLFNRESLQPISKFVLRMGLPLLIFTNIINGVERNILLHSGSVLMAAFLFYVAMFFISMGVARLFHVKGKQEQIYQAMSMFGNIGFMGIPIITSIYPENGILYVSVFSIVDQLFLWTLGVKLTAPEGEGKFNPKKLVNPASVGIVVALFMILTGIKLPELLNTGFTKIGSTATPLAMIYLGGTFACVPVKDGLRRGELYGIVLVKMLLVPVVMYMIMGFFGMSGDVCLTLSLIAGMPVMASIAMMVMPSDSEYAMGGIFITTIGSLVTLPLVCFILQSI